MGLWSPFQGLDQELKFFKSELVPQTASATSAAAEGARKLRVLEEKVRSAEDRSQGTMYRLGIGAQELQDARLACETNRRLPKASRLRLGVGKRFPVTDCVMRGGKPWRLRPGGPSLLGLHGEERRNLIQLGEV